jgi:hypothetical protein
MAFSDPQSVVHAVAGTVSLPRVSTGQTSGVFSNPSGSLKLSVSHAYNKRTRRVIRLDLQKLEPDPLFPDTNVPRQAAVMLIVDAPPIGFTVTELEDLTEALTAYLAASSGAAVTKLLGGES